MNLQRKEGVVKHLLLLSSLEFQARVLSRQRSGTQSLTQICADGTGTGQGTHVSIYPLSSLVIIQRTFEASGANYTAFNACLFLNLNNE